MMMMMMMMIILKPPLQRRTVRLYLCTCVYFRCSSNVVQLLHYYCYESATFSTPVVSTIITKAATITITTTAEVPLQLVLLPVFR